MKKKPVKKKPVAFKLDNGLIARLKAATEGRYRPTMTAIVERGIELALAELKKEKVAK